MLRLKSIYTFFIALLFTLPYAGSQDVKNLVLIGNLAESNPNDPILENLFNSTKELKKKNTWLVGLGDYTDHNGISDDPGKKNQERLQFLKSLSKESDRTILIAGDRDWDNSGKDGMKKVKRLEKFIKEELNLKKTLLPGDACPGPTIIDVSDEIAIIAINSQWLLHPYNKPLLPNTDCDISSTFEFWEAIEDALDDNEGKRIFLMAHHPIVSNGRVAGKQRGWNHLIPVAGSFYNSFRKNIGYTSDFANPDYKAYRHRMEDLLADHANIIFISSHDSNLEVNRIGQNTFINSGALTANTGSTKSKTTLLQSTSKSFSILSIDKNLEVILNVYDKKSLITSLSIPWIETKSHSIDEVQYQEPTQKSFTKIAGEEYRAGSFHRFWMGDQYRKEWTTPIEAPSLILSKAKGGLTPYARGGGLQTNSLKFKAPDGSRYSFRSVNKNPERALGTVTRQTIYRHIVKDLITTQHPYGGLVAAHLLDQTDILHVNPELYILPHQTRLGDYNTDFGGSLGTLELRPSTKSKMPFAGADNIVSSHQMFHALYKYDDHKSDKQAYARARTFDMLVGDWDRHEDNWKWAVYKDNKKTIYRPIPRDRDHVFSKWEGVIPSIADMVISNAENFDYNYGNLKHLNWKARHLDRQLGNELTLEDWLEAGKYLQSVIDTSDIREAINTLPAEVKLFSGEEIEQKLINRLNTIDKAVAGNYLLLSKEVDIVGSNKKEKFTVKSADDNNIRVTVVDEGRKLYDRVFISDQTKSINLFGLEGNDDFNIEMQAPSPILIRIISGHGEDKITDDYPGVKKNIEVYDKHRKDKIKQASNIKMVDQFQDPVYNNKLFEYPATLPFVGIKNSSGNGLGVQLTFSKTSFGFNKPQFKSKFALEGIYYPGLSAHFIDFNHRYRHLTGTLDGQAAITYSSFYSKFPFFYGLGNDSRRDHELAEDEFYRIDYNIFKANYGLAKTFWRKSNFLARIGYQYNNIQQVEDENSFFATTPQVQEAGKRYFGTVGMAIDINFKDNDLFTTNGSQLLAEWNTFLNNKSNFSNFSFQLAQYQSYHLLSNTTFIVRAGGATVIGDAPFYMLSPLGSNANLRGHVRNRFIDRSAIYYNTEIRMHAGTWRTVLAPLKYGIFGFHDSGKVFSGKLNFKGTFHSTYGIGFYIAPIDESYSLTFSFARSDDRDNYFRMDFGWSL